MDSTLGIKLGCDVVTAVGSKVVAANDGKSEGINVGSDVAKADSGDGLGVGLRVGIAEG